MTNPYKPRTVQSQPQYDFFKPRGIPLNQLETTTLSIDELEAMRLRYFESLDQAESAKRMNVSTSTYQRILAAANRKITEALLLGKAIKLEGGKIKIAQCQAKARIFKCEDCKNEWSIPCGTSQRGLEIHCPKCKSANAHRIDNEGHGAGRQPWGYKRKSLT